MKSKAIVLLISLSVYFNGNAQNIQRLDSVSVSFMPLEKSVSDSSGLMLKIAFKNLTRKPKRIYKRLEEGSSGDRFSNVHIDLQIKDSTGKYLTKVLYNHRIPDVTPAHRHFDVEKKSLPAIASDTLLLDLLQTVGVFWEGDYRIKVYLRVKTILNNQKYDYKDETTLPPEDEIGYIESDWIYFKVNKYIQRRPLDEKGRPRG